MTVKELIQQLQLADQDKEVKIFLEVEGRITHDDGTALSVESAGRVVSFDDCVGITRVL